MIITSIEQQKNSKNRVSVFIDYEFAFGISKNDLLRLKLYKNYEISNVELEMIKQEIILDNAKEKAYNYLSYKPRTKSEINTKLTACGFTCDIIEKTIKILEKYDYINDESYVKLFIKDAKNNKKVGINKIKWQLRQKGIANELIDLYLNDFNTQPDVIKGLIIKKLKGKELTDIKDKKKILDYLYRKGFSYSEIIDALNGLSITVDEEAQSGF